jgi:hypothetical protein
MENGKCPAFSGIPPKAGEMENGKFIIQTTSIKTEVLLNLKPNLNQFDQIF